ncbi:MAG: SAM-dependent methyltransferase [Planctomycetota bacterium]
MESPVAAAPPPPEFLLCACQGGAEAALRTRFVELVPGARPAAWRRGVVTFRLPGEGGARASLPDDLLDRLGFARTLIHSLGQVTGPTTAALAAAAVALAGARPWRRVHCWTREFVPGPQPPALAAAVADAQAAALAASGLPTDTAPRALAGELVLDLVLDSPERWWVGWHQAGEDRGVWPGGIYPTAAATLPSGKVSRAWLKLDEAIAVFDIPFLPGERAVELGAAPGGACQRLLEAGLRVVGVDPAVIDPAVAALPGFTHWRMRARDVPLARFAGTDWLVADMNIDPKSTLSALGRVATAKGVRLSGIVATLKIPNWSRAAELPGWLDAFRAWGFAPRVRQLSSAGREVCVVATRASGRVRPRPARPRREA